MHPIGVVQDGSRNWMSKNTRDREVNALIYAVESCEFQPMLRDESEQR